MYLAAADAILRATHIIVAAGAGMSADSGLPVYDAIAEVSAYKEASVSYADLCKPSLLSENPGLGLGFWGGCFNMYRETEPHAGYSIVRSWCEGKRGWYVYTSNVDGHFARSGFEEEHICEIHGRLDRWIPSKVSGGQGVVLPPGHRYLFLFSSSSTPPSNTTTTTTTTTTSSPYCLSSSSSSSSARNNGITDVNRIVNRAQV